MDENRYINRNKFSKVSFYVYREYATDPALFNEYRKIKLPCRATTFSAGYDFFAPSTIYIEPGDMMDVATGIRVRLDYDKFLALYPKSGLGFKYQLGLANTIGVIDSDYYSSDNEGHIMARLVNRGHKPILINEGAAFMQGVIQQYFITEDDDVRGIRNGGFGSTGV